MAGQVSFDGTMKFGYHPCSQRQSPVAVAELVRQRKMKSRLFIAVACAVFVCGCEPVLMRYEHPVVTESATLKVIERSTESNDLHGKPLSGRKIGLPIKSILTGRGYVVTVFTPMNFMPMVFLKADDEKKKALDLRGAHLRQLKKESRMSLDGYRYSFILDEATGDSIEFDIVTDQGVVLGHEKIKYDVISRGYVWVIDHI